MTNKSDGIEESLIELQTRLAFQEDTVQQLNEVVTEQDSCIRGLQIQVQSLARKLEEVSASVGQPQSKVVDERPPHY